MDGNGRAVVLLGLMGGLFLAAMDATVLAIAMPTVVAELGGEDLYGWAFTAYMLPAAVSMPILGALSDLRGRIRYFLVALGLFVAGSVACGLAPTMPLFLASRALQGVGGGGLLSIPFAIAGALFTGADRGRALGRLSSVWGVAAIAGPVVGGVAVTFLSWEWIFFVNLPVGLLGGFLVLRHHGGADARREGRVDLAGAALLVAGAGSLLLSLDRGVPHRPVLAAVGAVLLAAFALVEARVGAPILPLRLLSRRRILGANVAAALAALAIFAAIAFVPRFVVDTYGEGSAFLSVLPLSVGWSGTAVLSGRRLHRTGVRAPSLAGLALLGASLAGAPLFLGALPGVVLGSLAMGVGMGLATPALLLAVQNAVGVEEMGVATASQTFLRNVGGAVGIVALGALIPPGAEGTLAGVSRSLVWAGVVAALALLVAAWGLQGRKYAS